MDTIYSRKKIKLPKFSLPEGRPNKKRKKIIKFTVLWTIVIVTVVSILRYITPVFEELCKKQAENIATQILNIESSKVIQDVDYNTLVDVVKDKNENITMIKANVIQINLLASDIAYNIQKELNKEERTNIKIPLGSLSGINFLGGIGPDILLKIVPRGTVLTDFKSEFSAAGINQTLHRIYLEVTCKVSIITPYKTIDSDIINQVLFAEGIIIGNVPNSYYNLEGLKKENAIDIIE